MRAKDLRVGQTCKIRGLTYIRISDTQPKLVALHLSVPSEAGRVCSPTFHVDCETEVEGKELSAKNVILIWRDFDSTRIYCFNAGTLTEDMYTTMVLSHGRTIIVGSSNEVGKLAEDFSDLRRVQDFLPNAAKHIIYNSKKPAGVMQAFGDSVVVITGLIT
jgi:hypothetical protein